MASAAAAINTSFVWQQGLIRALRGSPQMPQEEFMLTLRKIIAARQEGKFPLAEKRELLACENHVIQEMIWEKYQALQANSDLSKRAYLLTQSFFTTVANTTLCKLTPEQIATAQQNYLLKMFDGVKEAILKEEKPEDHPKTEAWFEELASNTTAQEWFKGFALASYSKVIDALDKLFEGLTIDLRQDTEKHIAELANKYIMPASSEDLKRFIHTIKCEKLAGKEDDSIKLITEGPLWEAYVNYRDLAGKFPAEKQQAFWEARITSLETYIRRLEAV